MPIIRSAKQTLAMATLALAGASACLLNGAQAQMSAGRASMTIATATQTGNYFATGNALCRLIQRQGLYLDSGDVTLFNCGTMPTGGSVQNIDLLRLRTVDVALVQSDWVHHANKGTSSFEGRKVDNLRALFSLNPEAFQVLAGRGTRITSWADLKAKKVNLGPNGSTSQSMFKELLDLHKVDSKWLTQGLNLPVTAHVQELCEGNIEALGQTTGVPNSGLGDAIQRCGATLVNLDTPEIQAMVDDRQYYDRIVIPRGTYSGQETDVVTFGVFATLVTTTELSNATAYSIVRATMEGLEELAAMLPVLRGLEPKKMISAGLSVPLHPGAERYYRERGWINTTKPTAKMPAAPAASTVAPIASAPAEPSTSAAVTPPLPSLAPPPAAKVQPTKGRAKQLR